MADAITGVIGAIFLIIFILLIATKINELALWLSCLAGIALMLWSIWVDDFLPLFGRRDD